jgi:hypothetical protein
MAVLTCGSVMVASQHVAFVRKVVGHVHMIQRAARRSQSAVLFRTSSAH